MLGTQSGVVSGVACTRFVTASGAPTLTKEQIEPFLLTAKWWRVSRPRKASIGIHAAFFCANSANSLRMR